MTSRRLRPTRTRGTAQSKKMLPPGMVIPKGIPRGTSTGKPIKTGGGRSLKGGGRSLKDAMNAWNESQRKAAKVRAAGKARSTGTPKAPTRTKRPTTATPKRATPTAVGRPRRPARPPVRPRGRRTR